MKDALPFLFYAAIPVLIIIGCLCAKKEEGKEDCL